MISKTVSNSVGFARNINISPVFSIVVFRYRCAEPWKAQRHEWCPPAMGAVIKGPTSTLRENGGHRLHSHLFAPQNTSNSTPLVTYAKCVAIPVVKGGITTQVVVTKI